MDHLLLQCSLAREFWLLVFSSIGIDWVMSKLEVNMFASWTGKFGRHSRSKTDGRPNRVSLQGKLF